MSILKVDTIQEKTSGNGVVIPSGQTLKAEGLLQAEGLSIQTVIGTTTTQTALSTGGGWVDSTLTATITPKFNTSKILIMVAQQFRVYGSASGDSGIGWRIVRDSTVVQVHQTTYAAYTYSGGTGADDSRGSMPLLYLDSPATTSATVYKTQVQKYGSETANVQDASNHSEIVLMEIAQ